MTTAKNASYQSASPVTRVTSSSMRSEMDEYVSSVHDLEGDETGADIRRATLDEIRAMRERGDVYVHPTPRDGVDLPDAFWDNAVWEEPLRLRQVNLKLEASVFDHFVAETGGKGHITRMQNVLKSYVETQKRRAAAAKAKVTES